MFRAGELTGHHVRAGAAAEDLRHLPAGLSVIRTGFQREEAGAEDVLSPTGVCRLSRGPPQCCREWASSLRALSASGRQGAPGSCPVAAAIPCAKRGLKYVFRALPNQSVKELWNATRFSFSLVFMVLA